MKALILIAVMGLFITGCSKEEIDTIEIAEYQGMQCEVMKDRMDNYKAGYSKATCEDGSTIFWTEKRGWFSTGSVLIYGDIYHESI